MTSTRGLHDGSDPSATRDALSAIPKAGVEMLVRAIAVEEGRFGVRCNAVSAGLLEGEGMAESLLAHGDFDEASLAVAPAPSQRAASAPPTTSRRSEVF